MTCINILFLLISGMKLGDSQECGHVRVIDTMPSCIIIVCWFLEELIKINSVSTIYINFNLKVESGPRS